MLIDGGFRQEFSVNGLLLLLSVDVSGLHIITYFFHIHKTYFTSLANLNFILVYINLSILRPVNLHSTLYDHLVTMYMNA